MVYLAHHGVKGQKWGIRRYQNPDGSLTDEGKRRYGYSIKSGSTLYRISENKRDSNNNMYVSYKQVDRNFYKGNWPLVLRQMSGNQDARYYEQKYTIKTDIVSPNMETRRQIAKTLYKTDRKILEEMGESVVDVLLSKQGVSQKEISSIKNNPAYKQLVKNYIKKLDEKDENELFTFFNTSLHNSPYNMERYAKELKKNGFNAVIDDYGRYSNSGKTGRAPLIIFDPKDVLEWKSSQKLTTKDEDEAWQRYLEWYYS